MSTSARLQIAESAAAYAKRPRLVADASVLVAMLFSEANASEAAAQLSGRVIAAPHLLDLELGSAALHKLKRGDLTAAALSLAMDLYEEIVIERHAVPATEALALALRYNLTTYDAAYLWLAAHLDAPLATFDEQLAAVAREHLR